MSKMKQFFITDVWDYRLSVAQPINYRGLPESEIPEGISEEQKQSLRTNWVASVYSQSERGLPLDLHDTGIKYIPGDADNWNAGHEACYKWYRSVRDIHSQ